MHAYTEKWEEILQHVINQAQWRRTTERTMLGTKRAEREAKKVSSTSECVGLSNSCSDESEPSSSCDTSRAMSATHDDESDNTNPRDPKPMSLNGNDMAKMVETPTTTVFKPMTYDLHNTWVRILYLSLAEVPRSWWLQDKNHQSRVWHVVRRTSCIPWSCATVLLVRAPCHLDLSPLERQ